jgi:hypothetical protein
MTFITSATYDLARALETLETAVALPYDPMPPISREVAEGLFPNMGVTIRLEDPSLVVESPPGEERRALEAKVEEIENRIRELQRQLKEESEKLWPSRSEERIGDLNAEIQRLSAELRKLQVDAGSANEELSEMLKALQGASSPRFPSLPFEIAISPFARQRQG